MTDKMREEFERTNGRDHRRSPPKGNNYIDPMAQADWEAFQKGWAQALGSVEIELPEVKDLEIVGVGCTYEDSFVDYLEVVRAIEDAGLRIKPC